MLIERVLSSSLNSCKLINNWGHLTTYIWCYFINWNIFLNCPSRSPPGPRVYPSRKNILMPGSPLTPGHTESFPCSCVHRVICRLDQNCAGKVQNGLMTLLSKPILSCYITQRGIAYFKAERTSNLPTEMKKIYKKVKSTNWNDGSKITPCTLSCWSHYYHDRPRPLSG